jgi:hypothetical protein
MSYWVIGGEYQDTSFKTPSKERALEQLGPFETYKEAHDAWATRAWATVESCMFRYRIFKDDFDVNGDNEVEPPCEDTGHHPSSPNAKPKQVSAAR